MNSVNAYEADGWSDFGVAVAGAGAALAGLLFVVLSINLTNWPASTSPHAPPTP